MKTSEAKQWARVIEVTGAEFRMIFPSGRTASLKLEQAKEIWPVKVGDEIRFSLSPTDETVILFSFRERRHA